MTKIILISHGMLAEGMANSIQMVAGKVDNLSWLSLHPGEEPETLYRQLEQQIHDAPQFTYILLTDIPGGSVNTALSKLCALPHVFLVSGMNLGLALNVCLASPNEDPSEYLPRCIEDAKEDILDINQWMHSETNKQGEEEFYD
ncbi:MAG: PTS sugar transporter subunit IIA [Faecalibacterium sp.]|nr:PTS sugar transporter subunit IIA [Faecalibacterium sp.]